MNPLIPSIISSVISAIQQAPEQAPPPPMSMMAVRPMPAGATKAVMNPPEQGTARFGDKRFPLSPALQIRSAQNLIVQPATMQQPVTVRYLVDAGGSVNRVWILTAEEASLPDTKAEPQ